MSIQVICPNCQASYQVDEAHAGKQGKCKKCGSVIAVPFPSDDLCTSVDTPNQDEMKVWYISYKGARLGPSSEKELRSTVAKGVFSPNDMIWRSGMEDWKPIHNIFHIEESSIVQDVPPPLNHATFITSNKAIGNKFNVDIPDRFIPDDEYNVDQPKVSATAKSKEKSKRSFSRIILRYIFLIAIAVGCFIALFSIPIYFKYIEEHQNSFTSASTTYNYGIEERLGNSSKSQNNLQERSLQFRAELAQEAADSYCKKLRSALVDKYTLLIGLQAKCMKYDIVENIGDYTTILVYAEIKFVPSDKPENDKSVLNLFFSQNPNRVDVALIKELAQGKLIKLQMVYNVKNGTYIVKPSSDQP